MTDLARAHGVLADARAAGVFPSATAEVGSSAAASWNDAVGTLTFDDSGQVPLETPYDLASLDQGHRDDDRSRCSWSSKAR